MSFMDDTNDKIGARPDLGRALVLYAKRIARMELLKRLKNRSAYQETVGHIMDCELSLIEMAKSKAMEAVCASFMNEAQATDIVKFLASEFITSQSLNSEDTKDSILSIMELESSELFERVA